MNEAPRAVNRGFSLLELLMVLVLVGILISLALPSYRGYVEARDLAQAKQYSLSISLALEKFKARNFSYQGFNLAEVYPSYDAVSNQLFLPIGATADEATYILSVVDQDSLQPLAQLMTQTVPPVAAANSNEASVGRAWAIRAERAKLASGQYRQPRNFDLLLSSTGRRCMTQSANMLSNYRDCGSQQSEAW